MAVQLTLTTFVTNAGVPVTGLTGVDLPEVTIWNADTGAVIQAAIDGAESAGGFYRFLFTPTAGVDHVARWDNDPAAAGNVTPQERYSASSFSEFIDDIVPEGGTEDYGVKFQRLDDDVTSRNSVVPMTAALSQTEHDATQSDIAGLNNLAAGAAMDLVANAVDATSVATDAIDADALATSAVNEIRDAILSDSTPFAGANVNATISSRATQASLDIVDQNVDDLEQATIAAQLTAATGSTTTEVRTGATQATGFYDDLVLVIVNSAGVVARRVTAYNSVNGAFTVNTLPFTPAISDPVVIVARTALSSLDTVGIADAVWDELRAGHTDSGSFGEFTGDATMRGTDGANTTVPLAAATDQAEHDATQADIAALADPTAADVADAVWDEAIVDHTGVGSFGEEVQAHAQPGDAMDLVANAVDAAAIATDAIDADAIAAGAIDAAAIATNAIDADALATDAVNEIRDSILSDATTFAGANINATISSRATQASLDVVDQNVDDIEEAMIAAQLTAATGSTTTEIRTAASQADGFYDGQVVVVVNSAGVVARTVTAYLNTNGAFTVPTLPFTPSISDPVIVIARTASASVDLDAIADAVWDELRAGHVDSGSFGEFTGDATMRGTDGANTTVPLAAATDQAEHDATQADIAALNDPTADDVADQVWDELRAAHVISDSFGEFTGDATMRGTDGANTTVPLAAATDQAEHDATQADIAALNDPTADAVADQVWNELIAGHVGVGSFGEEVQAHAQPGDAMDLIANAVDAAAIATDAIDADALATSGVNEIRDSILSDATTFAGANINATISSRASQTSLDVVDANVDDLEEALISAQLSATSGSTSSEVRTGATQADDFYNDMILVVVNSAGVAARSITDYANTNGAFTVSALPFTPSVSDPVIVLSAVSAAVASVDNGAIADAVWDELRAGHTDSGSYGEFTGDATMRGTDGANTTVPLAAATDQAEHDATQADIAALNDPTAGDVADQVWDELIAAHVGVGSFGEEVQAHAVPGDAMDLVANAVDAAAVATDAIDADALATDAVNEIRDSILSDSTSFPGASIDATISSRATQTSLDVVDQNVDDLVEATISAQLTAASGSTTTEVRTAASQADDFYNDMILVVVNSAGVAARAITDFANTNGAFTVDPLPFTPSVSDPVIVLARTAAVGGGGGPSAGVIADAVWDELRAGHTTSLSFGEFTGDDAMRGTDGANTTTPLAAAADQAEHDATQSDIAALNDPTAGVVADAVWDELRAAHVIADSFGQFTGDATMRGTDGANTTTPLPSATDQAEHDATQAAIAALVDPSVDDIADGVWDEARGGHTAGGSFGQFTGDATMRGTDGANTTTPLAAAVDQAEHDQTQTDIGALNDLAQADILSDATPFAGADIAAILSDTELVQYLGAIWIDTANGAAGAVVGVNGLPTNPVDNLANAFTLAASTGLRAFTIRKTAGGPLTLTQSMDDWTVTGIGEGVVIALAGQDVDGTLFRNVGLSGVMNGRVAAFDCALDGITEMEGNFFRCELENGLAMPAAGGALVHLEECSSHVAGLATPTLSVAGTAANNFHLRGYKGGIEITNADHAGTVGSIDQSSGQAILGATNTLGAVVLRGVMDVTDTSGGSFVVTRTAALNLPGIADAVWDELLAAHATGGSAGEIIEKLRKVLTNRALVNGTDTLVTIFEDDDSTPAFTFTISSDRRDRTP